jgi:hypothetical protein
MSYTDVVIYIEPDRFLETWPPIYRGQERTVRDRLRISQVDHHVYSRYTPCSTDFTFEFIRRPIPPILNPSFRTFVELTLVRSFHLFEGSPNDHQINKKTYNTQSAWLFHQVLTTNTQDPIDREMPFQSPPIWCLVTTHKKYI